MFAATESTSGICLTCMSSSEINYAQIEKELLAIVYGCERFNMYTYGAEIEVLFDHKPLESVFKKPLFRVPPRLQRMRPRLQKYNLKMRYVPGKFLYIADTLSRAFDQSNIPTKVIAKGIESLLPNLVHSDQTGFIKGRYIGQNIRLIIDIMEHTKSQNIPSILVSLDFQKAFDSLEWSFRMNTLDILNFGTSIKR